MLSQALPVCRNLLGGINRPSAHFMVSSGRFPKIPICPQLNKSYIFSFRRNRRSRRSVFRLAEEREKSFRQTHHPIDKLHVSRTAVVSAATSRQSPGRPQSRPPRAWECFDCLDLQAPIQRGDPAWMISTQVSNTHGTAQGAPTELRDALRMRHAPLCRFLPPAS